MKKIIIWFVFCLIFIVNSSNSYGGFSYTVEDVCLDENCYSTGIQAIDEDEASSKKFLSGLVKSNFTFEDKLINKNQEYTARYGNTKFEIDNYCGYKQVYNTFTEKTETKYVCETKRLSLTELLNINSQIKINGGWLGSDKIYANGEDYYYSNYSEVLSNLNSEAFGTSQNFYLSQIDEHILGYNKGTNSFSMKNMCTSSSCSASNKVNLSTKDSSSRWFASGTPDTIDNFSLLRFVDAHYSGSEFRMFDTIDLDFEFKDILPSSNGGNPMLYEYKISYKIDGETEEKVLFEDTFGITEDLAFTQKTRDHYGDKLLEIFDITVNPVTRKVNLIIKETATLSKVGNHRFYFYVKNYKGAEIKDVINIGNINVLPGYPEKAVIKITNVPEKDSPVNFHPGDTITAELYLKDSAGNNFYDSARGINVGYAGVSSNVLISKGDNNYSSNSLSGLKDEDTVFKFKILIDKDGIFENSFNISYFNDRANDGVGAWKLLKTEIDSSQSENPKISPNFFIESTAGANDFNIQCGQAIEVKLKCDYDNLSGCDVTQTYLEDIYGIKQYVDLDVVPPTKWVILTVPNDEKYNGYTRNGFIKDKAYNSKQLVYTINHIDTTAPTIGIQEELFTKEFTPEGLIEYYTKTKNEKLKIYFYEKTASECTATIKYTVKIGDDEVIPAGTISSVNGFLELPYEFLEQAGDKPLTVETEDEYGNKNSKTFDIKVNPNDVSTEVNLTLENPTTPSGNKMCANNIDKYEYKLSLKDQFGNPIKDREVTIKQKTGLETIYSNYTDTNSASGLVYDGLDISGKATTNENGEIEFTVGALAPGYYHQNYIISVGKWDDKYNKTGENDFERDLGLNQFLKPFTGFLSSPSGEIKIGTTQRLILGVNNECFPSGGEPTNINFGTSYFDTLNVTDTIEYLIKKLYVNGESVDANIDYNVKAPTQKASLITQPIVTYSIGGVNVRYQLGDTQDPNDSTIETEKLNKIAGIKVVGRLQGDGKQQVTGQNGNYTDFTMSDLRESIKKNAYDLIRG
ncbi:MAG: Ig-like domain-containing protein, partial [Candidatus Gracilibacteria bacterium]|nr:Ig-like domain-containing protein [Candidatus Gracilibacteria bacterium]